MPEIGDTIRASDIGFRGRRKYRWCACADCGKERWVGDWDARQGHGILCLSCATKGERHWNYGNHESMRGSKNPSWKGGRNLTVQGYIEVFIEPNDFFFPMAHVKSKDGSRSWGAYVLEHRLVMAKYLNRCLLPWEIVHHKNGIKTDNRLENLQLLPSRQDHVSDSILKIHLRQLTKKVSQLQLENKKLREALQ